MEVNCWLEVAWVDLLAFCFAHWCSKALIIKSLIKTINYKRFIDRVIIWSWRILISFRKFIKRLYFCMVKYFNFHNSSFALRYIFNVNGKAKVWHTPCLKFSSEHHFYLANSLQNDTQRVGYWPRYHLGWYPSVL